MNTSFEVSIIIPCYNVENTVNETLESVLLQTYKNIEIILIDDGSNDGTLSILKSYAEKHENIKLIVQENKGLPASRNAGADLSSGTFLLFLDSDDKLHPTYVEKCINKFRDDPNLDLVYSITELFEAQSGRFALSKYSYKQILIENCIPATAMIKARQFKEIGGYDSTLRLLEDWDLWIRYLYRFPNVFQIQEPLFFYRKRWTKDSMTDRNIQKGHFLSQEIHFEIFKKHYAIYSEYGYAIENLFHAVKEAQKYRKKYYNVWYRKLFYQIRKRGKD